MLQTTLKFNQCAVAVFILITGCCYLKYDTPKTPTLYIIYKSSSIISPVSITRECAFLLQAIKKHDLSIVYSVWVWKPSVMTIITKSSSPTKSNIKNFNRLNKQCIRKNMICDNKGNENYIPHLYHYLTSLYWDWCALHCFALIIFARKFFSGLCDFLVLIVVI